MTDNERFIYSSHFAYWENEGLKVEKELLSYSKDICKYTLYRSLQGNEKTKSASYSAHIDLYYSISSYAYPDGGGVTVVGISLYDLQEIILDVFREHYSSVSSWMALRLGYMPLWLQGGDEPIEDCFSEIAQEIQSRLGGIYFTSFYYTDNMDTGSSGGYSNPTNPVDGDTSMPIINTEDLGNGTLQESYQNLYDNSEVFRNLLEDFYDKHSIAHLKWELSEEIAGDMLGYFDMNMQDYTFKIVLNADIANYSEELVFKTMLHESIHAQLTMDIIKSYEDYAGRDLNNEDYEKILENMGREDFPTLYDYYKKYSDHVKSQHELMADYYINPIKDALYEVIPALNIVYRTAIAWMGLTNTEAWEELPEDKRNMYIEIQMNYLNNIKK